MPRRGHELRLGRVIGALALLIGAAVVAIYAGLYNIAADVPHTQPVYWLLETVRERSVAARARDIVVPSNLLDANRISKGAGQYADMCSGCHLAPGIAEKSHLNKHAGLIPINMLALDQSTTKLDSRDLAVTEVTQITRR